MFKIISEGANKFFKIIQSISNIFEFFSMDRERKRSFTDFSGKVESNLRKDFPSQKNFQAFQIHQ